MGQIKDMTNIIEKVIKAFFVIMTGIILILLLFFSNTCYICRKEFLFSNIVMMSGIILCIITGAAVFYCLRKYFDRYKIPYSLVVKILAVLLFLFQIYMAYNIYFRVGWDVNTVFKAAKQIAYGHNGQLNSSYFSRYSNNLFLASFYSVVLKAGRLAGICTKRGGEFLLIIINCLISTASCMLIFNILRKFFGEKSAFAGFLLGIASFGISPWVVVPYSDSVGLIFPVLILYVYVRDEKSRAGKIFRYFLIIILSAVGYMIKPQIVIMPIAIIMTEAVHAFNDKNRKVILKKGFILVCGIVLSLTVFKCADLMYEKEGFVINKELSAGAPHFLKMGLNKDTNGVYSREDVDVSIAIATRKERNRVNIDICKRRLADFGFKGYMLHLWKKTLVNYNDGTFAWGVEGGHFKKIYKAPDNKAAEVLRSFYYTDGKNHIKWGTFAQAVWLLILFLCFVSGICRTNEDNRKMYSVLLLAIMGLTAFELLFEARARYLYAYTPVYCILAGCGVHTLYYKNERSMLWRLRLMKEK